MKRIFVVVDDFVEEYPYLLALLLACVIASCYITSCACRVREHLYEYPIEEQVDDPSKGSLFHVHISIGNVEHIVSNYWVG